MNANCVIGYDYSTAQSSHSVFSAAAEQQLLMQYLPLVKRIVNQLSLQVSAVMDREDMEQIGLMGLLESLRRYGQPDENFGKFAGLRIRGAILDELRRQDWRPRQIRQETHKLRDAIRQLSRQLGRNPEEEEILNFTGITAKAYQDFLQADAGEAIESLDELLQNGNEACIGSSAGVEERVIRERLLAQALSVLSERERLILTLYYQHELSLKEIALVLELTDARICQLSKQAIAKATHYLTERN
ncbi:FliA/WhiG family RNA polymerase sigma factor [Cellvibrio polysaccharolyticus]|uniref:FliA/WhiG family RNA polymerase sigma factor n=1 Tax=Cellvibrio polysaccharolyticus TaxID=2082724 RepID=A0A928V111_9GAMM|nr:FliA/WhiG family RNA polymerase sigma factor [Cellvibrio polysaccharolyticus]MBE8715803.1 FliA/WhiG family RNA polymerase sigma factor [Cellvibrio polysaccharolyticus]